MQKCRMENGLGIRNFMGPPLRCVGAHLCVRPEGVGGHAGPPLQDGRTRYIVGAALCGRPQSLPPTGGKVARPKAVTDEGADERGITSVGTLISLASLDSFPL